MKRITIRYLLITFSLACFCLMLTMEYDSDFRVTSILPLTYAFVLLFIIKNSSINYGLGAKALVLFYCFRMCLLPLVCAMGNFHLEPDKNDYIAYYARGVFLIAAECVIVFGALKYFTNYFRNIGRTIVVTINDSAKRDHHLYYLFMVILTFLVLMLQFGLNVDYYSPITSQAEEIIEAEVLESDQGGAWWYITDMLSTWWRPLITISLIYLIINSKFSHPYVLIIIVSILNVYFMSDRRIHALLVGGFALFYAMSVSKSIIVKRIISIILVGSACVTLFFGFYTSATADLEMVARTFQRYFSGPTLNALALRVLDSTGFRPFEFVCLLLNDFQSYTAMFGRIVMPDYYAPIFGMSRGLWVPVTVGSFIYFGPFFPLPLIYFVYYIKRCDYDAGTSSSPLYSMIYYYLGVCTSCFIVMYTVELVFYFIIATGLLFKILIYFDKKIRFSGNRIIIKKRI